METGQERCPQPVRAWDRLWPRPSALWPGWRVLPPEQWGHRTSFAGLQASPSLQTLSCTEAGPAGGALGTWPSCVWAPNSWPSRARGPVDNSILPCAAHCWLPLWRALRRMAAGPCSEPGSLHPPLAHPQSPDQPAACVCPGGAAGSRLASHLVSEPGWPVPRPAELSLIWQKVLRDTRLLTHEWPWALDSTDCFVVSLPTGLETL